MPLKAASQALVENLRFYVRMKSHMYRGGR